MKKTSYTIRNIPKEIRDKFKAACALKGTDMRAALIKFMKEFK